MKKHRRKSVAQSEVQGHLVRRAIAYWMYCLLVVFSLSVIATAFTTRFNSSWELFTRTTSQIGIAILGALIVMPLVMRDLRWFSNRFVGPIERLRGAMHDAVEGRDVPAIEFRDDDFWQDLADDFNRLLARMEKESDKDKEDKVIASTESEELEPVGH